jgi:starch phosphorylase
VIPLYYHHPREFDKIRQAAIAVNGSFFNTQRMMMQYLMNAYVSI